MAVRSSLRMTRARSGVLEELRRARRHPTAAELYESVRRKLPGVSLATVYRALDALVDEGRAKVIEEAGGTRRYDARVSEHYHVVCERCGRLEDVSLRPGAPLDGAVIDACGYKLLGHRLCFVGLCPSCQREESGKSDTTGRRE